MKFLAFFISLVLVCLSSSCTRKIDLVYEPVIEKCEKKNIGLVVNPFKDDRKDTQLGSNRNLYGMPIIALTTDDDPTEWITNALKLEMENAGYTVTDQSQDGGYEVEGKLIRAYVTTYFIYHGRMAVEIVAKKGGEEIFRKTYLTKKSNGLNWIASGSSCSETLTINLQEICRSFISDFNQLLSGAPNLSKST